MEEYEVDLRDYLEVIWKRKWIIILVTVVAVGVAAAYSYTQPNEYKTQGIYELTELKAVVDKSSNETRIKINYALKNQPYFDLREIEVLSKEELFTILNSRSLVQKVVTSDEFSQTSWAQNNQPDKLIPWVARNLDVQIINSELLKFEIRGAKEPDFLRDMVVYLAKGAEEELAQRILSQIGREKEQEGKRREILESDKKKLESQVESRIKSLKAEYQDNITGLRKKIEEIESTEKYKNVPVGEYETTMEGFALREQYGALNQRLTSLQRDLDRLNLTPHKFFPNLYDNLNSIEDQINQIDRRINSLTRLESEFSKGNKLLEPLDPPYLPAGVVGPNRKMNIAVAGVLGIFLGTLLAFFVEYMSKPREGNRKHP